MIIDVVASGERRNERAALKNSNRAAKVLKPALRGRSQKMSSPHAVILRFRNMSCVVRLTFVL